MNHLTALALLLTAITCLAWTYDGPRGGPEFRFERIDQNADARLSWKEFEDADRRCVGRIFREMDADQNAVVSPDEVARYRSLVRGRIRAQRARAGKSGYGRWTHMKRLAVEEADLDRDGALTMNEILRSRRQWRHDRFRRLDKNGDRIITFQEFDRSGPGRPSS